MTVHKGHKKGDPILFFCFFYYLLETCPTHKHGFFFLLISSVSQINTFLVRVHNAMAGILRSSALLHNIYLMFIESLTLLSIMSPQVLKEIFKVANSS